MPHPLPDTSAIQYYTFIYKMVIKIQNDKPLIGAYQGPYKDKIYFWVGLQLVLRAVLFAVSLLDRNTNLIIGIVILTGILLPYRNEIKNYQKNIFSYEHFITVCAT